MPRPLFDNKNTSDKDNEEVTFAEFVPYLKNGLRKNPNDLNVSDEKVDPSDNGVHKIEENDKSNKHVDVYCVIDYDGMSLHLWNSCVISIAPDIIL